MSVAVHWVHWLACLLEGRGRGRGRVGRVGDTSRQGACSDMSRSLALMAPCHCSLCRHPWEVSQASRTVQVGGTTGSLCLGPAKVHPPTECEVGLPCCVPALWCSSALSVLLPVPSIPSITCRRSRAMHVTLMQQRVQVQSLPALEVT